MARKPSIRQMELQGMENLRRALVRLEFAALRRVRDEAVEVSAEEIEREAKARVAVDEGTTHDSIKIIYRDAGMAATIGSGYFNARFIEHGVNGKPARPFLNPAFQLVRPKFVKRLEDALNNAGKEAGE